MSTMHMISQSINRCFFVHQKVDKKAGQCSLLHVGITKSLKQKEIELKRKTDEQINPVNICNRQLISNTSRLLDASFIFHMLYKTVY